VKTSEIRAALDPTTRERGPDLTPRIADARIQQVFNYPQISVDRTLAG
jgi:hypothetical protein